MSEESCVAEWHNVGSECQSENLERKKDKNDKKAKSTKGNKKGENPKSRKCKEKLKCIWCDNTRERHDLCGRCRQKVESRARRIMLQKIGGDWLLFDEIVTFIDTHCKNLNVNCSKLLSLVKQIGPYCYLKHQAMQTYAAKRSLQPWTLPDSSVLSLMQDLYELKHEIPCLNGTNYSMEQLTQLDRKSLTTILEQKIDCILENFKSSNNSENNISNNSNSDKNSKNDVCIMPPQSFFKSEEATIVSDIPDVNGNANIYGYVDDTYVGTPYNGHGYNNNGYNNGYNIDYSNSYRNEGNNGIYNGINNGISNGINNDVNNGFYTRYEGFNYENQSNSTVMSGGACEEQMSQQMDPPDMQHSNTLTSIGSHFSHQTTLSNNSSVSEESGHNTILKQEKENENENEMEMEMEMSKPRLLRNGLNFSLMSYESTSNDISKTNASNTSNDSCHSDNSNSNSNSISSNNNVNSNNNSEFEQRLATIPSPRAVCDREFSGISGFNSIGYQFSLDADFNLLNGSSSNNNINNINNSNNSNNSNNNSMNSMKSESGLQWHPMVSSSKFIMPSMCQGYNVSRGCDEYSNVKRFNPINSDMIAPSLSKNKKVGSSNTMGGASYMGQNDNNYDYSQMTTCPSSSSSSNLFSVSQFC